MWKEDMRDGYGKIVNLKSGLWVEGQWEKNKLESQIKVSKYQQQ
jgi:hypothetical protein